MPDAAFARRVGRGRVCCAPVAARDAKFYGKNACLALFARRPDDVRRVFVNDDVAREVGDMLRELARRRLPYRVVDNDELAKVAGSHHHEGICIVARPQPPPDEAALLGPYRGDRAGSLIYLDGVENPHNVGAILRTAAHFGCAALAGSLDRLPTPSGATARVAEGGAEHVPVLRWADPLASLRALRSRFTIVAGTQDARHSLYLSELPRRAVFLLGAEGAGLSREVRALASMTVAIPGTGAVESLNVSNAAALLLGEHWRRFAT